MGFTSLLVVNAFLPEPQIWVIFVVAALSEVPHDFRDVVVLVDIGDFTYADAAQILDIPIGTVMSRLHRGRRILKQAMAEAAVGGEVT